MQDWIDFYDSAHSIYVSRRHRDVHFSELAKEIIAYIPSPDAVVIDYSCGEALASRQIAAACGRLILAEPAPNLRARLAERFRDTANIEACSLDALAQLPPQSVDLVVMNSVAQYVAPDELDRMFAKVRALLKPGGRFVLGDILQPKVGAIGDALTLLDLGRKHGFLLDAFTGLVRTALSDYRALRSRIGLQRYGETDMLAKLTAAGFAATRAPANLGHNSHRMTFVATAG